MALALPAQQTNERPWDDQHSHHGPPPPPAAPRIERQSHELAVGDSHRNNSLNFDVNEHEYGPGPVMSKKEIQSIALAHGGYATPSLNDQLYLHYKGYPKIENLDEYIHLKALWLDSNGLQKIENLHHLSSLRCLFLQRNLLSTIENLDGLSSLVQLDLSENRLTRLEGLESLTSLSNLNVSRNSLSSAASIENLTHCQNLSSVDFSHNDLNGEDILQVLSKIPTLLSLNMVGNPVTSGVSNFRKRMIVSNKSLRYLDRPIFDIERASAEAWSVGGREAELKVKTEIQKKKREEERASMEQFRAWQAEIRAKAQRERKRLEEGGEPTAAQKAEQDERQRRKVEREAKAAMEAARDREIYHIDVPSEAGQISIAYGLEDDDSHRSSSYGCTHSDSDDSVAITILEDTSSTETETETETKTDETPPPLFPPKTPDVSQTINAITPTCSEIMNEQPGTNDGKKPKQNPTFSQAMDIALCKYVQHLEANFDQVAEKMSQEFECECTRFTPDLCRVRWCLLDSATNKPMEPTGKRGSSKSVDDDMRPLLSFQSPDQGQGYKRATFQELCGMESTVMKKPLAFPSSMDDDHAGVDSDDNEDDA